MEKWGLKYNIRIKFLRTDFFMLGIMSSPLIKNNYSICYVNLYDGLLKIENYGAILLNSIL